MRVSRRLAASLLIGTLGSAGPAVWAQPAAIQPACEILSGLKLPHTRILTAANAPAQSIASIDVPARCVVKLVSSPARDSEILIEVWLPLADWNGKYLQVGNGGWSGVVPTAALASAVRRGYAAAGTDDGHSGSPGGEARWAIGHPEKVVDFAHRAVHETATLGRAVANAFYSKDVARSYFVGCSTGGRQALMEAQRYPGDFDGIIAGAPANNMTGLQSAGVWNEQALLQAPDSAIPLIKLRLIQRAVLAVCDDLDGLKDGLLQDPRACHFDPAVLKCKGADAPGCLSSAQLTALRRLYAGPTNPRTGARIYPGQPPGTEAVVDSWRDWLIASPAERARQFSMANAFFGQIVREGTGWNFRDFEFDADVAYARRKTGALMDATSPDLRSFRARGGKLIHYHGWGDAAIAPGNSIDYYEQVRSFMATYPDAQMSGRPAVEDFYRLFMVPGMAHCTGGIGPGEFGNGLSIGHGPEDDVVAALDRWVEEGIAPQRLIGHGPAGIAPARTISQPLCPYPSVAQYLGQGNPDAAASYACAMPAAR